MKFKGAVTINKPIALVTQIFADPNSPKEYQDGFVKKELQKGEEGKNGAISTLYYKYGNRDMVLTETVIDNSLPTRFEAFYHHKHMDNTMTCRFKALGENQTKYEYEFEYTRISWVMPKLMAILFPGTYKKHGHRWMKQFKEFVEKQ